MSGHSKWSKIKHQKAIKDPRKSALFSKLAQEIMQAAKDNPDIENNSRLASVVERAKRTGLPLANIRRAIEASQRRRSGQLEEFSYEAYGPGGGALIIEGKTDNKNRALSQVRHVLSSHNGRFASPGSVIWMFEKKGVIILAGSREEDAESLALRVIEFGVKDIEIKENKVVVYVAPEQLQSRKDALQEKGFKVLEAKVITEPKDKRALSADERRRFLKLLEELRANEDVEKIFHNVDL